MSVGPDGEGTAVGACAFMGGGTIGSCHPPVAALVVAFLYAGAEGLLCAILEVQQGRVARGVALRALPQREHECVDTGLGSRTPSHGRPRSPAPASGPSPREGRAPHGCSGTPSGCRSRTRTPGPRRSRPRPGRPPPAAPGGRLRGCAGGSLVGSGVGEAPGRVWSARDRTRSSPADLPVHQVGKRLITCRRSRWALSQMPWSNRDRAYEAGARHDSVRPSSTVWTGPTR
ncbi:MAG: hypothetical protein QOG20_4454 [Pseudonocardiales bacterium]|jgi:hypothetical protein|nr:hypothetical protein [Pseudonocardiales bacterium]